jgi:hypothetical protein
MRALIAAGAAVLLALSPTLAAGQDKPEEKPSGTDYAGQVRQYLGEQAKKHVAESFAPDASIPDFITSVRLDGGVIWPINLHRGVTYRVFAVCDNDCSDVDMDLYDSTGRFVGRDITVTDTPYVEITPTADGVAYARIWLAACESEPCFIGARVYRKR